jgi:large subunit ribosomal protein L13
MKTLVAKQLPAMERTWYIVDAKNQTLGRLATQIARTLSGRNKVDYTPHIDNGDYVVVINAKDIRVSGAKENVKMYYRHSGYLGGLKELNLAKVRVKNPIHILQHAVTGMLPKNRLQKGMVSRLRLEVGQDHAYLAQKPIILPLI